MSGVFESFPIPGSPGSGGSGPAVNIAFNIGSLDGQAAVVTGASVSSVSIFMQSATATFPGVVSSASQTFSGVKTFSSSPNLSSLSPSAILALDSSKNVIVSSVSLTTQVTGNLPLSQTSGSLSLTAQVVGVLPLANGGTNTSSAFSQGAVVFQGPTSYAQDSGGLYFDSTNRRLGLGTNTPTSIVTIAGNQISSSWSITGPNLTVNANVLTDSSTASGTVPSRVASSFGIPQFGTTNSVTITTGVNLYVQGPPSVIGTNTSITFPWSLVVASGNNAFSGMNIFGNFGPPLSCVEITPSAAQMALPSWTTIGPVLSVIGTTLTDTTGTASSLALRVANSFSQPNMANVNSTTITNAATLFVANAPGVVGSQTTITNPWATYISAGNSYFGGKIQIGTASTTGSASINIQNNLGVTPSRMGLAGNGFTTFGRVSRDKGVGSSVMSMTFNYDTFTQTSDLSTTGAAGIQINTTTGGGGLANITFHIGSSGGYLEAMRIDQAGNVGIFNTNPATSLDVLGSISGMALRSSVLTLGSITITSSTGATSYSLNLPGSIGSGTSYLGNDGVGNLSWRTAQFQYLTTLSSGTSQTYTVPTSPSPRTLLVKLIGAGGGGGGCAAAGGAAACGGGGGGGAYTEKLLIGSAIATTFTYTVGDHGLGGVSGNNSGGAGGTSIFGPTLTAVGGTGGAGGASTAGPALAAGTVTGGTVGSSTGDINVPGGYGGAAIVLGNSQILGGQGGISQTYGIGGSPATGAVNGAQGGGYGGGGAGGGAPTGNGSAAGGNGAYGAIIIYGSFV